MADIDILEQKPISMAELKEKLTVIKTEKGELNFRADKVYAYLEDFAEPNALEVYKKLVGLEISKLRDRHIVKIVDLMPKDADSLKAIFSGEVAVLKQDEIQKILEVVNG